MSSQTISRAVVQGLAKDALILSVCGAGPWAFFTAGGLGHMGSLLTVGGLLLFVVIGVVTGALAATSICLWRAAQRLPAIRLSPEALAQEERKTMRRYVVSSVAIAAMVLAGFLLLLIFPHGELDGELAIPGVGLIFGIDVLLLALLRCTNPYMSVRLHYLIGGAFTLLAGVAVLALLFGVTLSGAYIWTVIVGLGFIVIFWLTVLFWMSVGERLLRQGTASGGDLFGQWQTQSETQETRNEM